jgi:hypothetical protein
MATRYNWRAAVTLSPTPTPNSVPFISNHNYVFSANAREKLKRTCSHNWKTFTYLQEWVHDGRIPERARSKMREIISHIRMQIYVKQVLYIW